MWFKRLVAFLCAAMVLGCSGLSSLLLENQTERAIGGTITMEKHFGKERPSRESTPFQLQPGESTETLKWFAKPPDWIELKFDSGSQLPNRRFKVEDYSPGMQIGSSGGAYYFLEISDTGIKFRDPGTLDKLRRNPQYIFLYAVCFGGPILLLLAAVLSARRSLKKNPAAGNQSPGP